MASQYTFLALENPLLDIQYKTDEGLLEKYGLKANDAILADAKHMPLYDEILSKGEENLVFIAGGAAQNTARGAQRFLPPKSTVYIGCVADDDNAEILKKAAEKDGLTTNYMVSEGTTGVCAVLITGHNRCLVTNLAAAELLSVDFVKKEENWKLVEGAKYYYVGAFCLTHVGGNASAQEISKHAVESNKTFALNLSAPFLSAFFKERLDTIIKNTDILFGNEDEARTYSEHAGWNTKDLEVIAKKLATDETLAHAGGRTRTVVITHGKEPTVVAQGDKISSFAVSTVDEKEIVDTNGAGDAFCGGFLGLYATGVSDIARCVKAGHHMARHVIRQAGPSYDGYDATNWEA